MEQAGSFLEQSCFSLYTGPARLQLVPFSFSPPLPITAVLGVREPAQKIDDEPKRQMFQINISVLF